MKKGIVDVITLGCSKNLVDSERLMQLFSTQGYRVEHDPKKVDGEIVVVNTCGFIGDAKEESINTILSLVEMKKNHRIGKLIVMGCLSQRYREELREEIPEVDAFYGKFDWVDLLKDLGKSQNNTDFYKRVLSTPSHYAYLKIAEGCDRTCSYCAIPLITGKYRSRQPEDILEEARELAKAGVKEIQLIAQDLTYYGLDLPEHRHLLPSLLEDLCKIDGIEWIRLHYAYPNQFPYDLLRVMREQPKICKYLDIALQHISNHMLKQMRRNITAEETYSLLETIREQVPGIHIRTTLMVGHPGETEEDFDELLQFVGKVRFERMGAFSYSHEEDTYSGIHYCDDIPEDVKAERMNRLMALQEEISYSIQEEKIGKTFKVIIDRKENEQYVGRTEFDSPDVDPEVLIEDTQEELEPGRFYNVEITGATPFELFGKVIL